MAARSITLEAVPRVPLINPGDDLATILICALEEANLALRDQDVLVVAQKIVSKAEGRYVDLASILPSRRARELAASMGKDARVVDVILSESNEVVRCAKDVLVVAHRLGYVMANAGVDQSNIEHPDGVERVLLLPRDPDGACAALKARLDRHFQANIGVVINDSLGRAWRNGVVGVALGAAGLPSLLDLIGTPDLFGRALRATQIGLTDEIAAAASLLMGQAGEGQPAVLVRGLHWDAPAASAAALVRPKHLDLFR